MFNKDEKVGFVTIMCDKCGYTQAADINNYNDVFFEAGWGMYPNAKKYTHKCRSCQTPNHRRAHDFVAKKFLPHLKSK